APVSSPKKNEPARRYHAKQKNAWQAHAGTEKSLFSDRLRKQGLRKGYNSPAPLLNFCSSVLVVATRLSRQRIGTGACPSPVPALWNKESQMSLVHSLADAGYRQLGPLPST